MGRGRRICLIIAAVLLLASLIPAYQWIHLRECFTEQTAAERWRGSSEARFSQVSCFLDESAAVPPEREYSIRESLENALAGESEERWLMALSGTCDVTVSRDSQQVSAKGIYTAGSFAHFHPMQMVSGSWFDDREVNRDGIVLDMQLAWKLFGGYDLQGMTVAVNGIPVQITGVARPPESGIEQQIFGQTPTVWLSMDILKRMGQEPKAAYIEAVLPDPVTDFALDQLKKAVGVSGSSCEYLQNTDRFSLRKSLEAFLHPDSRVMRTSRVAYPYWENAARVAESRCGIYTAAMLFLLIFPACVILYWVLFGLHTLRKKTRELINRRK